MYLNMTSKVEIGKVILDSVSDFEISETVTEISNTAKITLPRAYAKKEAKSLLDRIKVGDKVTIKAGYYREAGSNKNVDLDETEFTGYVREIDSDIPLVIYCDDETYPLKQNNKVKSYKSATLRQVLTDILPSGTEVDCPDVNLGKFMIDNVSSFRVLQDLVENYGLYSRYTPDKIVVNLRDLTRTNGMQEHTYILNPTTSAGALVKKNELKYKRKEDFKLRVKVTSTQPNGKKITTEVGSKNKDASVLNVTYPSALSESELKVFATNLYNKRCYDGYTGSITGFGTPRTHAGDTLRIDDKQEPARSGSYLIEKVTITYNNGGGYSRKNELSYKV